MIIACMGGWCNSRDKCQHYYSESQIVIERLCDDKEEPETKWAKEHGKKKQIIIGDALRGQWPYAL